jgi:hypothetical protein
MTETPTSTVACQNDDCENAQDLPLDESIMECEQCGTETWTYRAPEATGALTADE